MASLELQRILVATDFSEQAEVAVRYGVELARAFSAELILCHVVEGADILSQLPPGGEGYFPPNLPEVEKQLAEENCRRALQEVGFSNGRIIVGEGKPFLEIVRIARQEAVDLIVVGTHGHGPVAHLLLGSVAERVVRKADCPVLTVRKDEHDFVAP